MRNLKRLLSTLCVSEHLNVVVWVTYVNYQSFHNFLGALVLF